MHNSDIEIMKNLKAIKFLLAGILLKRNPTVKEVARVAGCSDKTLTSLFPDRKKKNNNVDGNREISEEEIKAEEINNE